MNSCQWAATREVTTVTYACSSFHVGRLRVFCLLELLVLIRITTEPLDSSAHSAHILTGSFNAICTLYCPHWSQMICSAEGMDESLEFYRLPLASSYKMCTSIITNRKGYSKPRMIVFLAGFGCLSWCQFLHVGVLPLIQKRHSTAVLQQRWSHLTVGFLGI